MTATFGPWIAALATGISLTLAVPPFRLGWLAWVAFLPLLIALEGVALGRRLALGSLAGLAWGLGTVGPWLLPAITRHLGLGFGSALGLTILAVWTFGAAYLTGFALIYPWLPGPRWLSVPAVWVLLEWLRGTILGGAPWSLLGHSQFDALSIAQLAELTGVSGLSFLVLWPAAALAQAAPSRRLGLVVFAMSMSTVWIFGDVRIRAMGRQEPTWRVQIVSGHSLESDPVRSYSRETLEQSKASLTVWPEGAVPGFLQEEPKFASQLTAVARERGPLLTGLYRYEGPAGTRRYFNSALLVDATGAPAGTIDKTHLVPFAERSIPGLVALPRPFSPGQKDATPLLAGDLRVGALICWEGLFPDRARRFTRAGSDVLVNLSSDLDLGPGAEQITAFSVFRAIENRRWLLRASGSGSSIAIDPIGRIVSTDSLAIGRSDPTPTFFTANGDLVTPASAALLLALLGLRGLQYPRTSVRGPIRKEVRG